MRLHTYIKMHLVLARAYSYASRSCTAHMYLCPVSIIRCGHKVCIGHSRNCFHDFFYPFSILEGLLNTLRVYFDVKLQVYTSLLLPVFNQDLLTVDGMNTFRNPTFVVYQ